jgi:hypothetical protein
MSKLVFDIETTGESWDGLDDTTQHVLTDWVQDESSDEADRERLLGQIREGLGFSPLTGEIVAIGVLDVERDKGVVYYQAPGTDEEDTEKDGIRFRPMSEKPIDDHQLENGWADKTIAKDPKKWKGPTQVGKRYSRAPLEWLELAAEACEFKAYKGRQEVPPRLNNKGKPWHESDSFEARILRGWAERRRKQPAPAPTTKPAATAPASGDADDFPFGANAPAPADDGGIGF